MFCPRCESEYREHVEQCPECEVSLVAELPQREKVELVPVLKTNNRPLLAAFQGALASSGIPHYVRGAEAASLMPLNATVVVEVQHLEAAKELLRLAEEDHAEPDSE